MLETFFSPKAVAVIGASRDPHKLGYGVIRNLIELIQGVLRMHFFTLQIGWMGLIRQVWQIQTIKPKQIACIGNWCKEQRLFFNDSIHLKVHHTPCSLMYVPETIFFPLPQQPTGAAAMAGYDARAAYGRI
jgi:hypothetical protein